MQSSDLSPLELRPDLEEFDKLVGYIEAFAEQNDVGVRDKFALDLAAEELFANTVRHAAGSASKVWFSLKKTGEAVQAVYEDDGAQYDPTARGEVDTNLPVEERAIGGLGIHLIRKTMQDFSYQWENGRNRISFVRAPSH